MSLRPRRRRDRARTASRNPPRQTTHSSPPRALSPRRRPIRLNRTGLKESVPSNQSKPKARAVDLSTMPSLDGSHAIGGQRRASKCSSSTTSSSAQQNGSRGVDRDKEKALERNIDMVIFGDVVFKSWYPSWYPKEIIGEKGLNGESTGIVVEKLYVCNRCFGYSKEVVPWARHVRMCERPVPGKWIYSHKSYMAEDGVWSVWEVDGGVDTQFCQKLSLFAKLFLDNKSVFFDVSGFNYFLLVHTSPTSGDQQIVGFFSKEKMSWDNNNLACILIFPPWQRKGLGTILMGVSYEISKREEIMGGPEKPISDLGKKGYRRYWGAEVARWLLQVRETDRKKGRGMVDVDKISKETWIAPEDCLGVLREMEVVEKAGHGKRTVERVRLDKAKVREWIEKCKIGLEKAVDEDGFLEGYGFRGLVEEEMVD